MGVLFIKEKKECLDVSVQNGVVIIQADFVEFRSPCFASLLACDFHLLGRRKRVKVKTLQKDYFASKHDLVLMLLCCMLPRRIRSKRIHKC